MGHLHFTGHCGHKLVGFKTGKCKPLARSKHYDKERKCQQTLFRSVGQLS